MSARLQKHFQHRDVEVVVSYTAEQLVQLHHEADVLATEARLAALEQRMLEADVEEITGTIATLESLQGCLVAVQAHPDRATLNAIQRTVYLQQERLGLAVPSLGLESLSDGDLTASLEAGIWDTIKRLWAALIAMGKRLIQYIIELFRGNAAKQKAYAAQIEAGRKEFEDSLREYIAKQKPQATTEDYEAMTLVLDSGILVSASAAVKDALNVAPREGKIDLKGLLSEGICDTRQLSLLKDRLFQGLQVLEQFQRADQATLETAITNFTDALYRTPLQGFRGPKVEGRLVHYHSKWTHPLGGVMLILTPPPEGQASASGHVWAANARFGQVVSSMVAKPYREAPLEDKEGAPLRLTKPEIMAFFTDVRDFAKAAAGYGVVYKTLFESFDQRQTAAVKPFADKVGGNSDNWADIKDTDEKRQAYMVNQNACGFITHLVQVAQRYAQLAQHTSNAHTKVLAGAAQLTRNLSDKITKKKQA